MGGRHTSPGILSGIQSHHVLLCRLITAQGYQPRRQVKTSSHSIPQTHSSVRRQGTFPYSREAPGQATCSSTTSTHRGPCEPAEPHRCRTPLSSHQGSSAALYLQGRREGAGTKIAGSFLGSRGGQRTLLRVLWILGSAPSHLPPSLSSPPILCIQV